MQTRSLAAASGVFVALGLLVLANRPVGAQPAAGSVVRTNPPAPIAEEVRFSDTLTPTSARPPQPPASKPIQGARAAPALSPEAHAGTAIALSDPLQRTALLGEALTAWAATDAGAALIWLEQHPDLDNALLVQAIGEGLAADPTGATFAMTYLAQDQERGATLAGALVRTLAAQGDSPAALRLARATPEGWTHEWTTIAFTHLAYEDAATALEALVAVKDPSLRHTTAAAIIAGWAERDPAELEAYAEVFPVPGARDEALATALLTWQQRDPAGAALFTAAISPSS